MNEPNGSAVFKFALPMPIITIPHIAPSQIDPTIDNIPKGNPRIKPMRNANLTSPKPIHSPRDTIYIIAKKAARPKPISAAGIKASTPR